MTLKELEQKVPELTAYTGSMPEEIRSRCTIRIHPAGSLIHQKDTTLKYFGIVAQGENRVINELENGNVYMIERNKAIDFIGEVTLLAVNRVIRQLKEEGVFSLCKGKITLSQDQYRRALARRDQQKDGD